MTDRGRPVALLVPTREDPWEELVVSGQVIMASGDGNVLDELPGDYGVEVSARLAAIRDDER